jgi:type III secretory pathway component EscS
MVLLSIQKKRDLTATPPQTPLTSQNELFADDRFRSVLVHCLFADDRKVMTLIFSFLIVCVIVGVLVLLLWAVDQQDDSKLANGIVVAFIVLAFLGVALILTFFINEIFFYGGGSLE